MAKPSGTIAEHKKLIDKLGYAWYGKLGSSVSSNICREVMNNENPRILLIHSGKSARYWAYIDMISKETPDPEGIPEYYRDQSSNFRTWFRILEIREAKKDVMSNCIVASSGASLSLASRHSMSPYFIITTDGGE